MDAIQKRTCYKCKEEKEIKDFYTDGKNKNGNLKYSRRCKTCDSAREAHRNKRNTPKQTKHYYDLRAIKLAEYKEGLSCNNCGMSFKGRPEICDFHHLDPNLKIMGVGIMIKHGIKRALEEAEKCTPLCANCHRTLHAKQRRSSKVEIV